MSITGNTIAKLVAAAPERAPKGPALPACVMGLRARPQSDEAARVRALERLDILDTAPEQPFDEIVELVQQVLRVPICAVSLVDLDRQWFKAYRGLDVSETTRDISICTHAIAARGAFTVPDATNDLRFADNPLVTGSPHIRSYAGIPLTTADGYAIGTLCAIDVVPRTFLPAEIALLSKFARLVIGQIELRQIASTDALTGIMSRRAWIDCAEREVPRARRYGASLSFLMIDIDRFKTINDRFGHPVGDQVIKQLAQTTGEQFRETDWFGRYGGEEFVAALPETNLAEAMILAERIRAQIAARRFAGLGGRDCTISIGVAALRPRETSHRRALDRADQALYLAKKMGRNRVYAERGDDKPARVRAAA